MMRLTTTSAAGRESEERAPFTILAPAREAGGETRREPFTIGDLRREFGVSARTLRFYEEKGLLDPARKGDRRLYSRRDRARLRYVLMGKKAGLSLGEVREILELFELGAGQRPQLREALGKFQQQIERLKRQKSDIETAIGELTRASLTAAEKLAAHEPPIRDDTRDDAIP